MTAQNKRVIVEHFEILYPALKRNADLLIGLGEEVLVTRPSLFGPLPDNIADIVFKSLIYRKMAHSAEDLFGYCVKDIERPSYTRSGLKHGFMINYREKPEILICMKLRRKFRILFVRICLLCQAERKALKSEIMKCIALVL